MIARRFRRAKCCSKEFTGVQFSPGDGAEAQGGGGGALDFPLFPSEQVVAGCPVGGAGGKLELGAAPRGHFEALA